MLGDTVNERAVRILLECNLVETSKGRLREATTGRKVPVQIPKYFATMIPILDRHCSYQFCLWLTHPPIGGGVSTDVKFQTELKYLD